MDPNTDPNMDQDEELAEEIRDSAEVDEVTPDRAARFYDRIRGTIGRYLEKRGRAVGTAAEFLLLVPDVFILLWRLTTDSRVNKKHKVLLGSAVAYYILPFDLIPEAVVGPIGYLDDLVFGVIVLNKVLTDTDPAVLRDHWSGRMDVLEAIRTVLGAAESLVGKEVLGRVKRMAGRK
jgi:uncharacterized membrane protein YkvA (DUF1232 family)